jgi:hypothetical protein
MKLLRSALLVALVAGSTSCAEESSPIGPSDTATLLGTWRATRAEFVSKQDANVRAEVVSQGGSLVLVIDATTCTWTFTRPGGAPFVATATWKVETEEGEEVLSLSWTSGYMGDSQFTVTLSGDTLTIAEGHLPYDFTANGYSPEDDSRLSATLARQ